jgi:hypothetical protein
MRGFFVHGGRNFGGFRGKVRRTNFERIINENKSFGGAQKEKKWDLVHLRPNKKRLKAQRWEWGGRMC